MGASGLGGRGGHVRRVPQDLMAEDPMHLQALVMRIRALPGVLSTSTFSFVETVKWVYSPSFIGE